MSQSLTNSVQTYPKTKLQIRLLQVLAWGTIAASVLGSFSAWHQIFDLMSHFRCQYLVFTGRTFRLFVVGQVAKVVFADTLRNVAQRNRDWAILPAYHSHATPLRTDKICLISFNVHTVNKQSAEVLTYLKNTR